MAANTDPKIFSMWEPEGKALGLDACKGVDIGMGRSMTTFVTPRLMLIEGGEVIEVSADGRGSSIYRKWPSAEAAKGHQPVFPKHVQNEQW